MASTFKMEPYTHRVDKSWTRGRGSREGKLKRAGYLSATPVYGPEYMTKPTRGGKGRLTRDIIAYDASIMTRVEYRPAPPPPAPKAAPAPTIAPATTLAAPAQATAQAAQAPATTIPKEEAPKSIGGPGANRGSVSRGSRGNMGVASNAFAGNIGSVNTEVQNDDEMLPYEKNNKIF